MKEAESNVVLPDTGESKIKEFHHFRAIGSVDIE